MHGHPLTLYDLSKHVLGYSKLSSIHSEWTTKYEEARRNGTKRFLFMKPRGSYKSTVFTISGIIDILLENYIENNGKITISILIVSATDTLASNILGEIYQHLTKNETLLDVFDSNRERKMFSKETQTELKFTCSTIMKEANLKSVGALSSIVSSHYDYIICDDLSNASDRESLTIRENKCKNYIDLISILKDEGMIMLIGTRWAPFDVLDSIYRLNEELPEHAKYYVEIDGVYNEDGSLRYPTIYNEQDLERLRIEKGAIEFASQYLNVILSEETIIFNIENFAFYKEGDLREEYKIDFRMCNHYMYVDPALGRERDSSVIIVGAMYNDKLYIRDVIMSNTMKPSALTKTIRRKYNEYNCRVCGIEANSFQSLLIDNIKRENEPYDKKFHVKIKEIKNYKNKNIRIESIEPFVTNGRIVFREDWPKAYPEFIEEICNYPVAPHDDAPDALHGLTTLTINKKSDTSRQKRLLAQFAMGIARATGRK